MFFVISAIAAGSHSVGFRPIYFQASPEHRRAISGFGNSIASCALVLGPVIIGSCINQTNNDAKQSNFSRRELEIRNQRDNAEKIRMDDWSMVAFCMIIANLSGLIAALYSVLLPPETTKEASKTRPGLTLDISDKHLAVK
jgi:hypothetical protein